jgi:hypothetical protein
MSLIFCRNIKQMDRQEQIYMPIFQKAQFLSVLGNERLLIVGFVWPSLWAGKLKFELEADWLPKVYRL